MELHHTKRKTIQFVCLDLGLCFRRLAKEFRDSPKIRKQPLRTRMLRVGACRKPSCSTHTHNLMGLCSSWGVVDLGTTTGVMDAGTSGFPGLNGLSRLLPPIVCSWVILVACPRSPHGFTAVTRFSRLGMERALARCALASFEKYGGVSKFPICLACQKKAPATHKTLEEKMLLGVDLRGPFLGMAKPTGKIKGKYVCFYRQNHCKFVCFKNFKQVFEKNRCKHFM